MGTNHRGQKQGVGAIIYQQRIYTHICRFYSYYYAMSAYKRVPIKKKGWNSDIKWSTMHLRKNWIKGRHEDYENLLCFIWTREEKKVRRYGRRTNGLAGRNVLTQGITIKMQIQTPQEQKLHPHAEERNKEDKWKGVVGIEEATMDLLGTTVDNR